MKRVAKIMGKVGAMVLTVGLAIASTGCIYEKTTGAENSLAVGARMPEFAVSSPEYGSVASGDLAGKRAAILFFRTTCGDCKREMPGVEEALRRIENSGTGAEVRFVAISRETDHATVVPIYWAEGGLTMPYYFDPEGEAFGAFEVKFVPTLYLVGTDGKVAHALVEKFEMTVDELVDLIEELP